MVLSGIMAGIDYSFCGVGGFYGSVGIHLAGCRVLAALIPAMLGMPLVVQVIVFVAVSAVCLVFTRPFVKRVLAVKK